MLLRIFLLLLFTRIAVADILPATLRDGSTRFLARSLGSACYTMDSVQRGLPCNPASAAKERKGRFDADFFAGTQMEYLKEAEKLLQSQDDEAAVTKFFSRRESVEAEVSVEVSFLASKWGVAVEPYRLVAVTRFENPSLPAVDLIVAEEQSLKGQVASYVGENFYAGLQARYTHVRFIGEYFFLSEAFASDREKLLNTQTQELIYLEPGILYAWEELPWQPQISAALVHWGVSSHKTEQYPIQPEGLLGVSVKPVVPLGLLELGLQLQVNSQTENARDAFRGALAYHLGILQAVLSVTDQDRSAGFLLLYKNFSTGLSYWDENKNRGVFVQLGASL